MTTERSSDPEAELAFGEEFRPLMLRMKRAFDVLADAGDPPSGPARSWRDIASPFAQETEALIAKYRLQGPFATYVRHIVREGFDVDFDLMDPTPHR